MNPNYGLPTYDQLYPQAGELTMADRALGGAKAIYERATSPEGITAIVATIGFSANTLFPVTVANAAGAPESSIGDSADATQPEVIVTTTATTVQSQRNASAKFTANVNTNTSVAIHTRSSANIIARPVHAGTEPTNRKFDATNCAILPNLKAGSVAKAKKQIKTGKKAPCATLGKDENNARETYTDESGRVHTNGGGFRPAGTTYEVRGKKLINVGQYTKDGKRIRKGCGNESLSIGKINHKPSKAPKHLLKVTYEDELKYGATVSSESKIEGGVRADCGTTFGGGVIYLYSKFAVELTSATEIEIKAASAKAKIDSEADLSGQLSESVEAAALCASSSSESTITTVVTSTSPNASPSATQPTIEPSPSATPTTSATPWKPPLQPPLPSATVTGDPGIDSAN